MVQGVRDVFEMVDYEPDGGRGDEGKRVGKLVLIGRGLDEGAFGRSLRGCVLGM